MGSKNSKKVTNSLISIVVIALSLATMFAVVALPAQAQQCDGTTNRENGCSCNNDFVCASGYCDPVSKTCADFPVLPDLEIGYCLDFQTGDTECAEAFCFACELDGKTCVPDPGLNCEEDGGDDGDDGGDDSDDGDGDDDGDDGGTTPTNLVPCGYGGLPRCTLCHLYNLADNLIDFMLFGFALPVAVIALLIGGIFLLASRGNPQMMETGKRAIANTVIGVVIAFAAWLIIATVVNTLGYDGKITPAWYEFPECKPSQAGTPSTPSGPECTPGDIEGCVTKSGTAGQALCGADEKIKECRETCDSAQAGTKKDCQVGNCTGITECQADEFGTSFWSACAVDPSCKEPPGGTCKEVLSGPCSVESLSTPPTQCFATLGVASEASQICGAESGGDPDEESTVDRATGGGCPEPFPPNDCPFSAGLFQVSFWHNDLPGIECRTKVFELVNINGVNRLRVIDQKRYNDCLAAAKNPTTNINAACQIYTANSNSWSKWSTAGSCGLN